jgi:hypothetical protein
LRRQMEYIESEVSCDELLINVGRPR